MNRARGVRLLSVLLVAGAAAAATAPPVGAQGTSSGGRNSLLGVAHVDVADLHVQRRAGASPQLVEAIGAGDLADRYARAADLGVYWHRWSIYWDLTDRGGTFDWTASDGIASRDAASGLHSLVVLQGNPPGVADAIGAPADIGNPIFLDAAGSPTDDPRAAKSVNPSNTFARFVAETVQRYRPGGALAVLGGWPASVGVRAYEIGNEPNSTNFWRGTPADFARYLEVGYLAVKWVDPSATVAHGGIANDANADTWFGAFLDALKARAALSPLPALYNYYYDRTAWHWYTAPSNLTVGTPSRVRQMQAERGLPAKPLWVTEFGAAVWSEYPGPCWDPASPGRVTLAEQSAFVWQSVAEGLASGAQLMVYFQLYDDCGNGQQSYDAFGLIRNHSANQCWVPPGQGCWSFDGALAGQPRPAYEALRALTRELAGARLSSSPSAGSGTRVVTFTRPGPAKVTIAWNTTRQDRSATLPASVAEATLFELDAGGVVRSRSVAAKGGRFSVNLPGATNHNGFASVAIAAGRPVLLVERGASAPLASQQPSGAVSQAAPRARQPASPAAPADRTAPVIALVGALPPESPPLFELQVLAADEQSNLSQYQVLFAVGSPPITPDGWTPYVGSLSWPGYQKSGQVSLPFVGAPGQTYYFAARAADIAGNWTPAPGYAQARTVIAGTRPAPAAARPPARPGGSRAPSQVR